MPDAHDDLRPLLFSIAYRMLGSVVEAEDVVQEVINAVEQSHFDRGWVELPLPR